MSNTAAPGSDDIAYPQAYRDLIVVCIALTLAMLSNTMLLLTVPFKALELGISASLIGLILSAPYILPLALAIPIGGFVARTGAQKVILFGSLGMAVGPICSLLFQGEGGLLANQVIAGMSNIVLIIAAQSLVAGLGHGKALERCFGWFTTCMSAGQLVGPLLAGLVIEHYSVNHAFVLIAAFPLLASISALMFTAHARQGTPAPRAQAGYRAQWRLLNTNRGVQLSILLSAISLFVMSVHSSFMPVYLESLAISAGTIGLLLSTRALASMLVRVFMSRIIQLLGGRTATIRIAVFTTVICLMLTGLAGDMIALLALLAVGIGIAGGLSQPLSMVILSESVSREQRAPSLAMRLMGNRGAQVAAPVLVGLIADFTGFTTAFALVPLLLLALFLFWSRRAGLGSRYDLDRR